MQTKYRTSRQSRAALENIRAYAERPSMPSGPRLAPAYGPALPIWQVAGELADGTAISLRVAATDAAIAVAVVRPRLRDGATATLTARPAVAS